MKKLSVIFFFIFFISKLNASVSIMDKKYSTYLDISFRQGINMIGGSYYGGGTMDSSFGALYDFNNKSSLALNYNILYNGPAVASDNRDLKERSIRQGLSVEWQKKMGDKFRIRPQLYIGNEIRKSGSIEDFDDNLYNNNAKGFGISLDYYANKKNIFVFNFLYRKIKFPNYTDLFLEFKNPGSQTNISGNLYDNNLCRLGFKWKYGFYFLSLDYTAQDYVFQKVVLSDGLYSTKLQKDNEIELKIGVEKDIFFFSLYPHISLIFHRSNQNFMRFKSFTDMTPVFVKDAYDYDEYYFALPLYFNLVGMDSNLSFGYKKRDYIKRPPRDINNDYINYKNQEDNQFILAFSFSKKINEIASVMFFYTYLKSYSNNKYDIYFPLNYSGSSFGFGYRIKY